MRDFYVYGFRTREQYTEKSLRTYDDERKRIDCLLHEYMYFNQKPNGKTVFLSIDSRAVRHNPLYRALKAKSFTSTDIQLHFLILDILYDTTLSLSIQEIEDEIAKRLSVFDQPYLYDDSTVHRKINEYFQAGMLVREGQTKTFRYGRSEDLRIQSADFLDFFSEAAPLGVIGSYLLDTLPPSPSRFTFKHHYITGTLDSEILCSLLMAMQEKRSVQVVVHHNHKDSTSTLIPLQIRISAQSGREYLMAYDLTTCRIFSFRIDAIVSVRPLDEAKDYAYYRQMLRKMECHIWSVICASDDNETLDQVEFTITYKPWEKHIHHRLEREKRCGKVTKLNDTTSRFTAEVYDANEMIPWIRTFICRIVDLRISKPKLQERFLNDLHAMYALYGLTEEQKEAPHDHAVP